MRLVLLLLFVFYTSVPELNACRKMLDQSLDDDKAANQFYNQLKNVKQTDTPVMVGFQAMSEFMLCKHMLNPVSRVRHFNRGKKLLESALQRDPHAAELHYFRLTTQSNVPALLRYSSNIKADKNFLISYLKNEQAHADHELYKRIKNYLLINPYCSAEEKNLIKTL